MATTRATRHPDRPQRTDQPQHPDRSQHLDRPQRTDRRGELGRRGEDVAAEFMVGLGYQVAARNWRCREGEIDLIVRTEKEGRSKLVFCEVKTRAGLGWGDPLEAITYDKARRLRQLAGLWLTRTGEHADDVRLDAIGVMLLPDQAPRINHVPGIAS